MISLVPLDTNPELEKYRAVYDGVCYLASVNQDQAAEQNGVGFNKPHSSFGNRAALVPFSRWDTDYIRVAWKMIGHYKGQLASAGIDYDAIPEPPAPTGDEFTLRARVRQQVRYDSVPRILRIDDSGKLLIKWGKNQEILEAFKDTFVMQEREWDKTNYTGWWMTPKSTDSLDKILEFCDRWGVTITDDALMKLQAVREFFEKGLVKQEHFKHKPKVGRYITQNPKNSLEYLVYFDLNDDIYNAIAKDPRIVRRYVGEEGNRHWVVTCIDEAAIDLLVLFAQRFQFEFRDGTHEKIQEARDRARTNKEASMAMDTDFVVEGLLRELRPFQRAGVEFAYKNGNILIGDEMGTGKSIQAIAAAHSMLAYPALIICPASLKYNWKREIEMTIPNATISVYEKGDPDLTKEWLIINYEMITKKKALLESRKWGILICDEAHKIKSSKAAMTKTVRALTSPLKAADADGRENFVLDENGNKIIPCERVLLLTGTPIMNRPDELITLLQVLGKMNTHFKNRESFEYRYCKMQTKNFNGKKVKISTGTQNLDELHGHLRNGIMIRRLKKDVLKELPPMTRVVVPCKIDNRAEYEEAELDIVQYVEKVARDDRRFLESIKDLPEEEREQQRREYAKNKAFSAARAEVLVKINHLRQIAAKGKLAQIKAWVHDFLESEEKLLIFAFYKDVVDVFGDEFHAPKIYGETATKKRDEYVQAFQNDPAANMLVLNMDSGGVGLTLTAASNSIFAELNWNPARITQAEARISRMGQTMPQTIYYFLDMDTIDGFMWDLVKSKQNIIDQAIDGGENKGFEVNEEHLTTGGPLGFANELMQKYRVEGEIEWNQLS